MEASSTVFPMLRDFIRKYNYFIFDVDGTIIDSINSVLTALKKAVKSSGITVSDSYFNHSLIGPKIYDIAKLLVPEGKPEEWREIASNFRRIYDADPCIDARLFPNLTDFFSALKNENKVCYVATNKPFIPTAKLLEFFGLNSFFDSAAGSRVYCPNSIPDCDLTKPQMVSGILENATRAFVSVNNADNARNVNKVKSQFLMVGDTKSDLDAAMANGIDFAFFYSGYAGNKDEIVNSTGTEFVFKDYRELYD